MGKKIAIDLIQEKIPHNHAILLALTGELGSGKTTFVQGIAEGLGIRKRVISPTFIILRKYQAQSFDFFHIDLYRLDENIDKELANIGFYEIIENPRNFIVVEWAEKAKEVIPDFAQWINFFHKSQNERSIGFNSKIFDFLGIDNK